MRRTFTVVATLWFAAVGVASIALAAEPASKPVTTEPAAPTPEAAKITKSRSNIQNNREAAPPESKPAPVPETQDVQKTRTKSNNSND